MSDDDSVEYVTCYLCFVTIEGKYIFETSTGRCFCYKKHGNWDTLPTTGVLRYVYPETKSSIDFKHSGAKLPKAKIHGDKM